MPRVPGWVRRWLPDAYPDSYYRTRQVRALTLIGVLGYWEEHSSGWVRERPALSYEKIRAVLRHCFQDEADQVRLRAIEATACLYTRAEALVPELSKLLKDPNTDIRRTAANALGNIGPGASNTVQALDYMLQQGNDSERYEAVTALGRIGRPSLSAHNAFIIALDSTNSLFTQRAAALAVFNLGMTPAELIPALRRMTNAENATYCRQAASFALWNLNPTDSVLTDSLGQILSQDPAEASFLLSEARLDRNATNLIPIVQSLIDKGNPKKRVAEAVLRRMKEPKD